MATEERNSSGKGRRLDSWKAIAEYLGREVRSVQRWETERALPVYRIPGQGRGVVFAYSGELDDWLERRQDGAEVPILVEKTVGVAEDSEGEEDGVGEAAAGMRSTSRRIALAGWCLAFLVVAGAYPLYHWWRGWLRPAAPSRVMLAVLPFANLSGDPAQDYFADGLTEEMITDVGRMDPRALGVIARTSVMKYKHTELDIAQIGRELGVSYVLEGSVRREGDTVRISAQLIQVSDQTHVWAQNYERHIEDILRVQQDVSEAIASKIRLNLSGAQRAQLLRAGPANPAAYDDYLKAQFYANRRDFPGTSEAEKLFRQSIAEDPGYAPAHAGLAESYTLLGFTSTPLRSEYFSKARAAAAKAIELDDESAEGHTALAGILVLYEHDWAGAKAQFERALQLDANNAHTHHWYANLYLDPQGRYDEAIAEMQRALLLDPSNLIIHADLGQAYFFARRYDEALANYQDVLKIDPHFLPAQWYLADCYLKLGREGETIQQMANSWEGTGWAGPDGKDAWAAMLQAYQASGTEGFWRAWLDHFGRRVREGHGEFDPPLLMAAVYLRAGNKDQAMAVLNEGYRLGNPNMIYIGVDPLYDGLQGDPRFQELKKKMGLLPG